MASSTSVEPPDPFLDALRKAPGGVPPFPGSIPGRVSDISRSRRGTDGIVRYKHVWHRPGRYDHLKGAPKGCSARQVIADPRWQEEVRAFLATIEPCTLTGEEVAEIKAFAQAHRGWTP